MKSINRTKNQEKIIQAMPKVYENLLAFKKRMNSELVVLQNDKIVRIKPD